MHESFEEFDGRGGDAREQMMNELIDRLSEATTDDDRERLVVEIATGFLQSMHDWTHDVTWEIRSAIHALGFNEFGDAIRQVLITIAGTAIVTGMGCGEFRELTDDEKEASDKAIRGCLWAHGLRVERDEDGRLVINRGDTFKTTMEREVAEFVEQIEETLGESTDEPKKGGWW